MFVYIWVIQNGSPSKTFEEFKSYLESDLLNGIAHQLLEFKYYPKDFGSGILTYRIKGKELRFIFDGKEGLLGVYSDDEPVLEASGLSADDAELKRVLGLLNSLNRNRNGWIITGP